MTLSRDMKMMKLFFCISFSVCFALKSRSETLLVEGLETHAFISQGFILSNENNYLAESTDGSFGFSEVGFNITKIFTPKLKFGIQFFAQDLGPTGGFGTRFDWYYMTYKWSDALGISFGRVKLPFGLYNDISDIDSARVQILLPQSIYPIQNRNFLLAQTGLEIFGYCDFGSSGALDYRVYTGTIQLEIDESNSVFDIDSLNIPYIVGSRLIWETPVDGLKLGGSVQGLRLDADVSSDAGSAEIELPASLWAASAEYSRPDWKFTAEYSRWTTQLRSSNAAVLPSGEKTTSERAYLLYEYRLAPRVQNGVYYSILYPDVDQRSGRESKQNDLAYSVRLDINDNWLVKAEAHYIHGTAALSPTLNDDVPRDELAKDWGVLLLKTTAYF